MKRLIGTVLGLLLLGYRKGLSPFLPAACRYYPSCSAYTEKASQKYGVRKGIFYGLLRIARCHPGCAGGYDPVK